MNDNVQADEAQVTHKVGQGHRGNKAVIQASPPRFRHTKRLFFVFFVLCLLSFVGAIDATIQTTSLPTITKAIGGERLYVWIANAFLFGSTIPQPIIGQLSDIFGRRNPMLISIALFTCGSGIAGGAQSATMLIAGRAVQGLGSAGLYVLSDIIMCDLVPARFRGPYLSAVLGTASLGTTIGPIVGGALARADWRWIFWLNLPIGGMSLIAMIIFLKVSYKRAPSWAQALARVDFGGFAIFAPALVAVLFGLVMGGTSATYAWGSYRIIVPIVLGGVGWILFHIFESSRLCKQPSMPPRLFKTRTSASGFVLVFLGSLLIQAINYFLPIYFQAVKGTSPLTSGVYLLPFTIASIFWGAIAGVLLEKTGNYRQLHWFAFGLCTIGFGLLSALNTSSNTGMWIGYQILAAAGPSIILTITLPSTLAALPETDVAVGTSTYSLIRSLGFIWGTDMAAIVFNSQIDAHLGEVASFDVRELLSGGAAYSYASLVDGLQEPTKGQVIDVYVQALKVVWWVMTAMSGAGFLCVFIERRITLRKVVETDFGFAVEEYGNGMAVPEDHHEDPREVSNGRKLIS